MLEYRNNGWFCPPSQGELVLSEVKEDKFTMLKEDKWDIGLLGVFFLTHKLSLFKNKKLPFKTNIPLFQHSTIPCMKQKHRASISPFNFSKLYNFRDVYS